MNSTTNFYYFTNAGLFETSIGTPTGDTLLISFTVSLLMLQCFDFQVLQHFLSVLIHCVSLPFSDVSGGVPAGVHGDGRSSRQCRAVGRVDRTGKKPKNRKKP